MSDTADFFRGRIGQMFDLGRPLAVLGARMPWQEIEASLAGQFSRRAHAGQRVEGKERFGPSEQRVCRGAKKPHDPAPVHDRGSAAAPGREPEALQPARLVEVVCMSRGEAPQYEFDIPKLGNATTLRRSLIPGARAFEGNQAVLCAAGYTIRCLLQVVHAKGLRACLRLLRAIRLMAVWAEQQLDGTSKHLALGSNLVICANRSPSWRNESIKQGRRS